MPAIKFATSLVTVLLLLGTGCIVAETGFFELAVSKQEQLNKEWGTGLYYFHHATRSDLRAIGGDSLVAMKILVERSMSINRVCEGKYEIVDSSFHFYEGNSASVYVRCD